MARHMTSRVTLPKCLRPIDLPSIFTASGRNWRTLQDGRNRCRKTRLDCCRLQRTLL